MSTPEELFTESIAANRELSQTVGAVNAQHVQRYNGLETDIADQLAAQKKAADDQLKLVAEQSAAWFKDRETIGDISKHCVENPAIFQGFINNALSGAVSGDFSKENVDVTSITKNYLHFMLPISVNTHSEMFMVKIQGHSHGSAKLINEVFCGYCYKATKSITSKQATGNCSPYIYQGPGGFVTLRIYLASSYYTSIKVGCIQVGNGRLFKPGDLVSFITHSVSASTPQ